MRLQWIARGPMVSSAGAAKKLEWLHQTQLRALSRHFGKKTSFTAAIPPTRRSGIERGQGGLEVSDDATTLR